MNEDSNLECWIEVWIDDIHHIETDSLTINGIWASEEHEKDILISDESWLWILNDWFNVDYVDFVETIASNWKAGLWGRRLDAWKELELLKKNIFKLKFNLQGTK